MACLPLHSQKFSKFLCILILGACSSQILPVWYQLLTLFQECSNRKIPPYSPAVAATYQDMNQIASLDSTYVYPRSKLTAAAVRKAPAPKSTTLNIK